MMEAAYSTDEIVTLADEDAKSTDMPGMDGKVEETFAEPEETKHDEAIDYEAVIKSDIAALKAEFPELRDITEITELNNPLRYAALRDLGLSPTEAYMATAKRKTQDTRAHLKSAHGRSAAAPTDMMTQYELATARELFPGLNDSDIQRLYKKVTK